MAETIYADRNNTFSLTIKEAGAAINLNTFGVNRVDLLYKEQIISSEEYPTAFDYTTNAATGVIEFDIARIDGIETGRDKLAEVIIYSAAYTAGIVWDTIDLTIKEIDGTLLTA